MTLFLKSDRMPVSPETYDYGTPRWAAITLCLGAIAFAAFLFAGFFYSDRLGSNDPGFIKWMLLAVGAVFLSVGLRPRNWQASTYFFADAQGLHFPSESPQTEKTEWLVVPWSRVGQIEKKVFYNRFKGPAIDLHLTDEEICKFFSGLQATKIFLNEKKLDNGFFRVGHSNAFQRPDKAVETLRSFKEKYTAAQ